MKELLLQAIRVVQPGTPLHGQQVDLLLRDGRIEEVAAPHSLQAEQVVAAEGWGVSAGWFDLRATLMEPGHESTDDMASLARSAAFGGFTEVAVLPNTQPVLQTKESVAFVQGRSAQLPITFHVIGALTKDAKGEDMAELYDLHTAGAVAFSNGLNSSWHLGVTKRCLEYLQQFDGLMMELAEERTLSEGGQMHEGLASTLLGMRGIPSIAEEIAIERILKLLEYTGGKIHFSNLSAASAVELVRQAKAAGKQVTCDVAAHQLYFTDEDLHDFDTNLKVMPPLRTRADQQALWEGLADGTIDAIVSSHKPVDEEGKVLEFDLATPGMLGLETAFGALLAAKPEQVSLDRIVEALTAGPRRILGMELPSLEAGTLANLTFFDADRSWTFEKAHIQSRSHNTPFVGRTLKGKALGIVHKGQVVVSEL